MLGKYLFFCYCFLIRWLVLSLNIFYFSFKIHQLFLFVTLKSLICTSRGSELDRSGFYFRIRELFMWSLLCFGVISANSTAPFTLGCRVRRACEVCFVHALRPCVHFGSCACGSRRPNNRPEAAAVLEGQRGRDLPMILSICNHWSNRYPCYSGRKDVIGNQWCGLLQMTPAGTNYRLLMPAAPSFNTQANYSKC